MKDFKIFLFCLCLSSLFAAPALSESVKSAKDVKMINEIYDAYKSAFESKNKDRINSVIRDEVEYFNKLSTNKIQEEKVIALMWNIRYNKVLNGETPLNFGEFSDLKVTEISPQIVAYSRADKQRMVGHPFLLFFKDESGEWKLINNIRILNQFVEGDLNKQAVHYLMELNFKP